jgi:hypothetical protein
MHRAVLGAGAAFVLLLLALTIYNVVTSGPDPLTVLSAIVLALLSVGLVGALRAPYD